MNEPSGRRWREPFARFDPDTSSWKTWQPSLPLENLPELPVTWPRSGSWDLGAAYALPTSVPPTGVCGPSSLLPTPNAADGMGGSGNSGRDGGLNLRTAATLLPTPTANDHKGSTTTRRQPGMHRHQLDAVVEGSLLPTPRATDGTKGGPNQRGSSGDRMLPSAVQLLPTPRASADRNSRAALTRETHWSAPSLVQALEMATGILPREYQSWDEVQGRHGAHMNQRSADGNDS